MREPQDALLAFWIAYALYWALTAVRHGRAGKGKPPYPRWVYVGLGVFAFLLLFYLRERIATLLIFLGLFYGAMAIGGTKRGKQGESLSTRLPHVVAMIAAFVLLFQREGSLGVLGGRFVPDSQPAAWAGVLLTGCGLALAIWARAHLSTNWSADAAIAVGHSLVRTGPYARVRHPIYSGLLLAISGTALAQGKWQDLLALVIVVAAFSIKAKREEALLRGEFGIRFDEHAQHTGFFLPRSAPRRMPR